jgi:Protein of unknown function (DUF998)
MTTLISPIHSPSRGRAASLVTALVTGPPFLIVAALLSLAEQDALRAWGWTAVDHRGVPWPSALELTSLGWIQSAAFALTGVGLVALARRLRASLPRRRAASVAVAGLVIAGAGMLCAAVPLDRPAGDPAELASWVGSWHAGVHVAGFGAAALGGLVAIVGTALAARGASPGLSRVSTLVAVVSLASLALPGALGWYAFLAGFFGWTAALAVRASER